jgi:hypothetical protein
MKAWGAVPLVRVYPVFRFVVGDTNSAWWGGLRVALATTVPALLVVFAAWRDHTFFLPGADKGLLEHYGFITFFITTPIVAFLSWQILRHLVGLLGKLPAFVLDRKVPQQLRRRVHRHWRSLALRSQTRWLLFLFALIGVYFTILNIRMTLHPTDIYGSDVFDSSAHFSGFVAGKIYAVVLFVLVYPVSMFLCLHTTVTLVATLRLICKERVLRLDFFHPDNCGGVSEFGYINVLVMGIYACFGITIAAMLKTHDYRYNVQALPMVVLSVLTVVQSFLAVYYLSKSVRLKKDEALQSVNDKLNQHLSSLGDSDGTFPDELLSVRTHLLAVKTYPYARPVSTVVNVLRFAPAVLALLHFIYPTK